MACAVGDTLVEGAVLLRVHDAGTPLPEDALLRAVRLGRERTFEQDPKHPIRLLVDIALKVVVAGDQQPDDGGPDHRPARGPLASPRRKRIGRRPRRRRRWRASTDLPDANLGGLSHPRIRRDPTLRLEFGSSDAADEVRPRRPRELAAEPKTGGGGATISRAPRPCCRSLVLRRRRPAHGAPGRPAGHWSVSAAIGRDLSRRIAGPDDLSLARDRIRPSHTSPHRGRLYEKGPLPRRSSKLVDQGLPPHVHPNPAM